MHTYTLADITEASNNGDLTSEHDIGRTLDTIDERLAAAVEVVELRLSDGVVDVDGGNLELALTHHAVEVVHTSRCLLGETTDVREVLGVLLVDKAGEITSVVEDHVEGLVAGEGAERLLDAPEVLLLGLALPCEDGDTSRSDANRNPIDQLMSLTSNHVDTNAAAAWSWVEKMFYTGKDGFHFSITVKGGCFNTYARRPRDLSAESHQRLDKHGGLDGPSSW